ncbi:cysteine hydrolase family protein [Aeromicrobium sp. CTD01-1L150]|uniref:cysteine hydrolase family protein n=1 Tax=Aeromicrobium sp. CTD01-1L150 TaxID=3341830 RepID=UPI0035C0B6C7
MRTGLIVVDMQNAFIDGATSVVGASAVVEAVNRWVSHASDQEWPIFYTRDVDPTGQDPTGDGSQEAIHRDVVVRGTVVDKGPGSRAGFSGFVLASTALPDGVPGGGGLSGLAGLILAAGLDEVVVVGLAADVCVAATAVDAVRLGLAVLLDLDASAFVHAHPGGDEAAVADLRAAGVLVTRLGDGELPDHVRAVGQR